MQTTLLADPHPREQTDRCKNIALPQTSFAGGKKDITFLLEWTNLGTSNFFSILDFVQGEVNRRRELLGPMLDIMSTKQNDEVSLF